MTTTGRLTPHQDNGVQHVLDRMRKLDAELPAHDGLAVFNRVYLAVTEDIARRSAAGWFRDPPAATALGVQFAGLYLAAVDAAEAGRRPAACWRPLFQLRRHPGVRPVQFALAGINAHIGHDLAVAVVSTCTALGCAPERLRSDYDRIDPVLVDLEERVREELMPGADLLDVADPLTHLAGSWCLERARDGAWAASETLWALRGSATLREKFRERLDSMVGMAGRFLLTPLG